MFKTLTTSAISNSIKLARYRVFYSAPSITDDIASALIDKHMSTYTSCDVVLDFSEDLFRLGYGLNTSVEMLLTAGIVVRKQAGLRIGCLIVDDQGWAFSLLPMAVESQNTNDVINAIELTPGQIEQLIEALGIVPRSSQKTLFVPAEIGQDPIPEEELESVRHALDQNPPQAFDLQRRVRVYQAHLQFVEVEFEGGRIEQRSIRLPKELKESIFANEKEVENRLNASYRLIDASASKEFSALRDEAYGLRDHYAPSLDRRLGRVLLMSRKQEFVAKIQNLQERLDTYCKEALANLQAEIERSLMDLATSLAPLVEKHPPSQLQARCTKVNEDIAKDYLLDVLYKVAPSAKKLLDSTKLHVTYKDVTLEMLQDPEFQHKVTKCFPYEKWLKPFEDYQAAQAQQEELV